MPPPYFVGAPTPKQGAHHESIRALWELKWKKRVSLLALLLLLAVISCGEWQRGTRTLLTKASHRPVSASTPSWKASWKISRRYSITSRRTTSRPPTTSNPTPPPSSPSPSASNASPKTPKNSATSPPPATYTSAPPACTAPPGSPAPSHPGRSWPGSATRPSSTRAPHTWTRPSPST